MTATNFTPETVEEILPTENQKMNPEEFAAAYRKLFRNTVHFLTCRGLSYEEAEEYAQAAWARGWERLHQLMQAGSIGPWINSIAWRLVLSAPPRQQSVTLPELADASSAKRIMQAAVEADEVLAACTTKERELLEARYLEGESIEEISEQLGISRVAVRVRLHRVKSALQNTLGVKKPVASPTLQQAA